MDANPTANQLKMMNKERKSKMKVKELMTTNLITAQPSETLQQVALKMKEYHIGALPICDQEKLIGIVTDRDIIIKGITEGLSCQDKIEQIMETNLIIGDLSMDVQEAAQTMSNYQVRRLPIIENGELKGILSLSDLALHPSFQDYASEALKDISKPGGNM